MDIIDSKGGITKEEKPDSIKEKVIASEEKLGGLEEQKNNALSKLEKQIGSDNEKKSNNNQWYDYWFVKYIRQENCFCHSECDYHYNILFNPKCFVKMFYNSYIGPARK